MASAGKFVNDQLGTSVNWHELVVTTVNVNNLQIVLDGMMKRIKAQDCREELKTLKENHKTLEESHISLKESHTTLQNDHKALQEKVEKLAKDLVERLEAKIKELNSRIDNTDEKVKKCVEDVVDVRNTVIAVRKRIDPIEEALPLKANKAEVDAEINAIKEEIEKMDFETIAEMARTANQRIDLMDERCDKMEDFAKDLKDEISRFKKEMEDMQLEKQIEDLKRELEEAKTGVFMKAQQRMDLIQKEADEMKERVSSAEGQTQFNRDRVNELEDKLREVIGVEGGGAKASLDQLRQDVAQLKARAAGDIGSQIDREIDLSNMGGGMTTLIQRLEKLEKEKADMKSVEEFLQEKADKESVEREQSNQQMLMDQLVQNAKSGSMNIQELLTKQSELFDSLAQKPSMEDITRLEKDVAEAKKAPDPNKALEDVFARFGINARGLRRPLQFQNCLSCERPIIQEAPPEYPRPSLPVLPGHADKGRLTMTRRSSSSSLGTTWPNTDGDSIVELTEIPPSFRQKGGAYTSTRVMQHQPRPPKTSKSDSARLSMEKTIDINPGKRTPTSSNRSSIS